MCGLSSSSLTSHFDRTHNAHTPANICNRKRRSTPGLLRLSGKGSGRHAAPHTAAFSVQRQCRYECRHPPCEAMPARGWGSRPAEPPRRATPANELPPPVAPRPISGRLAGPAATGRLASHRPARHRAPRRVVVSAARRAWRATRRITRGQKSCFGSLTRRRSAAGHK